MIKAYLSSKDQMKEGSDSIKWDDVPVDVYATGCMFPPLVPDGVCITFENPAGNEISSLAMSVEDAQMLIGELTDALDPGKNE